jgi:hypothetical protein
VLDLVDRQGHRAVLGVHEDKLVDGRPRLAHLHFEPPDERGAFRPRAAEQPGVVDRELRELGLELDRGHALAPGHSADGGLARCGRADRRRGGHVPGQRLAARRQHVATSVQADDELAAQHRHAVLQLLEADGRAPRGATDGRGGAQVASLVADSEGLAVPVEKRARGGARRHRGAEAALPRDRVAGGRADEAHEARATMLRHPHAGPELALQRGGAIGRAGRRGARGESCGENEAEDCEPPCSGQHPAILS